MRINPGKWSVLCRVCQQDVYFTIPRGWQHEGIDSPGHLAVPFAISSKDIFAAMGINVVSEVPDLPDTVSDAIADMADIIVPDVPEVV